MPGAQDKVIIVTGAGGGQVRRIQLLQSRGVQFGAPPTIAEVAGRWGEIMDMDGAVPGVNPVG